MVIVDNSPEAKELNKKLIEEQQKAERLRKEKELADLKEQNERAQKELAEAEARRQQEAEFEAAKAHAEKNKTQQFFEEHGLVR